jgi:hypothetical protein
MKERSKGASNERSFKSALDLTTPLGRGFLTFLSAMAEDERQVSGAFAG